MSSKREYELGSDVILGNSREKQPEPTKVEDKL